MREQPPALSFNFTFPGAVPNSGSPTLGVTITGIVDGFVDNLSGQKSGLTVTIASDAGLKAATVLGKTVDPAGRTTTNARDRASLLGPSG
jgi:hypothetical protein